MPVLESVVLVSTNVSSLKVEFIECKECQRQRNLAESTQAQWLLQLCHNPMRYGIISQPDYDTAGFKINGINLNYNSQISLSSKCLVIFITEFTCPILLFINQCCELSTLNLKLAFTVGGECTEFACRLKLL